MKTQQCQKQPVVLVVAAHLFILPTHQEHAPKTLRAITRRRTKLLSQLCTELPCVVFSKTEEWESYKAPALVVTKDNWTRLSHRGVKLYSACIYSICMQLGVYVSDVDPHNADHLEIITHWFLRAGAYIDYAYHLFQEHSPQRVVLTQGYFMDCAVLRQISVMRNVPVTAIELTFHAGKIIWDNVAGISVNKNLAKNIYWREEDTVNDKDAAAYVRNYLAGIRSVKRLNHAAPTRILLREQRKPYVLYLGQVYTDSSVLFGLADFHNPIHVIETLIEWCSANSTDLVLKLHPKESSGRNLLGEPLDRLTYRHLERSSCLAKARNEARCEIVVDCENTYDTYSLIRDAGICVTINSQAGLEALLFRKNLILCGQAMYGGMGFTWDAANPGMLKSGLHYFMLQEGCISRPIEIERFFYVLLEKYFRPRTEASWWEICFGCPAPSNPGERLSAERPLVFWGTGSMAASLSDLLNRRPDYYVDNDSSKWGQTIGGLPVKEPTQLHRDLRRPFVIIASTKVAQISRQLEDMMFRIGSDYL